MAQVLDANTGRRFVVDRTGRVAAASRAGLAALAGPQGAELRQELTALAEPDAEPSPGTTPLEDAGWLVESSA